MNLPKIYFQGEPGAFSEAAVLNHWPAAEPVGLPTFAAVFRQLTEDIEHVGLLPIENAYAGTVVDVLDLLIQHPELSIWAEVVQPIALALLGLPGMRLEDVHRVRSHPQALMQSRGYWQARGWQMEVASDTAGSARELAQHRWPGVAAIAGPHVAAEYGLAILENGIQDHADNRTRFWMISGRRPTSLAIGLTVSLAKTSLVFDTANTPGSLLRALQPFADAGINLTKIESRPRPHHPFGFRFWIDCEGASDSPELISQVIPQFRASTEWYRILGRYPLLGRRLYGDGFSVGR